MGLTTNQVRNKYDRYSKYYDFLEKPAERGLFKKWRRSLFRGLHGEILEIGVGTGNNLQYYPSTAKITAIDLSPKMLEKAIKKAKELEVKARFFQMDAQNLNFKDCTFDYVVCTFVLCSVPDPQRTLNEMKRVLKDRGKIITLDHVLSKNKLIALWQHIHNPLTRTIFGFNVNRDTKINIQRAKLTIIKDEKLSFFDVFRKFTCKK